MFSDGISIKTCSQIKKKKLNIFLSVAVSIMDMTSVLKKIVYKLL